MPGIDLSGFDVPGYEVRNIQFRDCTMGEPASVALSRCKDISLEIRETEEHKSRNESLTTE